MILATLILDENFEVSVLLSIKRQLLLQNSVLELDVVDLLDEVSFVLLQLANDPLEAFLAALNALRQCAVIIGLQHHLVPLVLDLTHRLVGHLQLVSEVVNVPLQGFDLGDIVVLLLLEFFNCESGPGHVFLKVEALLVQVVVLLLHGLDCLLVPLVLGAEVSVILKDVLLLHFKSTHLLNGESLLVLKLLCLLFEILVGLRRLREL